MADEDKEAGNCPATGGVNKGNPCEIGSGNKHQTEHDYQGSGTFPLLLTRTYNSLVAKNYPYTTTMFRFEPLGVGWSAEYFQKIEYHDLAGRATAYAYRPNGSIVAFNANATEFYPDTDINDQLSAERDVNGVITGWLLTRSDDVRELYDSSGRLLRIEGREGTAHTLTYDATGYLLAVTDEVGRQLLFSFDDHSRLRQVTMPDGEPIQYEYDGRNNLTKVVFADGSSKTYHYELTQAASPNLLTGITDESSIRYATFGYHASGYVSSTQHAGQVNSYTITYSGNTRIVIDPLGTQRTYSFETINGRRRVVSASAPCAGCSEYAEAGYDANGNVNLQTDFEGAQTTITHDLVRNVVVSRTEAVGTPRARTITTQWHPAYRLPTQIDEPGRRTTYTHDSSGNVLTKTVLDTATNESRNWTYTYNSFGQVLTADGPRTDVADVTTYTYYNCTTGYQCGQVNTITNALGHITTYNTYNAHGQPMTVTDPNGVVTTLTYDLRQRLTSRTVGTEVTSFDYWPTGLLKKATLPDGSYLEYTYDAAHRLTDINDAEGNRIHYTLDAMGNRTAEEMFDPSNALTQTRTRVFNTLNQLYQEIGAAGGPSVTTTYGYDNNGNQTDIDAPLGRSTTQTYDELNRLKTITDPESGLTTYGYDALDQLISVTDPRNLTTTYSYNALGDLKQQVSPDTGTTTMTYDDAGNLKTSTNARTATTTYTYDELDRVTTAQFKLGSTVDQTITYGYDAGTHGKGRLTSASDSAHSLSWTYDPHGRVLSKTQTVGAITHQVGYGYTDGQLTSVTTPSGQAIQYGYTNGQVTSITVNGTTVLSNALYDPFGPVRQWTWGNGTLSARTYDQDGKVSQIDSAGLNTYSYDDAFRITGITDTSNPNLSWTYGYDLLDRLTSASTASQSHGWTYDADGNRLTQTGLSPQTLTYPTTSNRLSSVSGTPNHSYTYNNAGDITGNGTCTFQYNARGRMKSTTLGSNITAYIYNALGQRIKKGVSRIFVYDEAGHLLGEYNNSGVLVQETVWLGDTPVATLRPKTGGVDIFYVHTDHLNTPRKITQPSDNKLRWRWDPTPFGTGAPDDNPEALGAFNYNLRFPGQYYDSESGLNYNYFRDYDPSTGRYVQSDPIGLRGGLNTYAYAHVSPMMFSDPTGLVPGPSPVALEQLRQRDCAQEAFLRNYRAMRAANWKQSDKYFHCKANCEAARCGKFGYQEACDLSDNRERLDQFLGDPLSASAVDQAANRFGRDQAMSQPNASCQIVCSRYRPNGLPAQY